MQRLYHEVRHALTHLYVKPYKPAAFTADIDSSRQWQQWSSGAGLGAVVDQQDLPGPQGTKQLHLRKKEGPDEEDLESVGEAAFGRLALHGDGVTLVLVMMFVQGSRPDTSGHQSHLCVQPAAKPLHASIGVSILASGNLRCITSTLTIHMHLIASLMTMQWVRVDTHPCEPEQ